MRRQAYGTPEHPLRNDILTIATAIALVILRHTEIRPRSEQFPSILTDKSLSAPSCTG
ncbi:hypothetical protein CHELA20_50749 [Hyphomicrobiales bacterium]|nr:hypothetical protein CHELA20_50749 [Hyphomicrobiales bacterium]